MSHNTTVQQQQLLLLLQHLDMFRPGGKYACAEEQLKTLGDKDGDGNIDWEEFTNFDWEQCFIDFSN